MCLWMVWSGLPKKEAHVTHNSKPWSCGRGNFSLVTGHGIEAADREEFTRFLYREEFSRFFQ